MNIADIAGLAYTERDGGCDPKTEAQAMATEAHALHPVSPAVLTPEARMEVQRQVVTDTAKEVARLLQTKGYTVILHDTHELYPAHGSGAVPAADIVFLNPKQARPTPTIATLTAENAEEMKLSALHLPNASAAVSLVLPGNGAMNVKGGLH